MPCSNGTFGRTSDISAGKSKAVWLVKLQRRTMDSFHDAVEHLQQKQVVHLSPQKGCSTDSSNANFLTNMLGS
ncbi:unnamed protein product [Caretta caretta]